MAEQDTLPVSQSESTQAGRGRIGKTQLDSEDGRAAKRMRLNSPIQMTAAAAHLDERRKSPAPSNLQSTNPQAAALETLMGVSNNATSPALARAEPATTMSQGLATAAANLHGPTASSDDHQTSPVTSVGTIGSTLGVSGAGTAVASPQAIDAGLKSSTESVSPQDASKYSQGFLQPQTSSGARGMSLPGSSSRQDTRSPSNNKKHRCPYCSTEFTRHHNLKSHLLTHSQEKPYVCATCQSRFRRLHDLKRHTKLHTGERPHVCPRCNRKFARGDALARHNKGPGGCAGRRASMGSLGDEDAEGEETMEGVVFDEPGNMDDDEGVSRSTPQIRRQAPSGDDSMDNSGYRLPSTYPPIQGRPPGSFPPPGYGQNQQQYSSGRGQVFAQNPMTESPGPLSPGQRQATGSIHHERSPSGNQYAQPYPRGSSGQNSLNVPPHGPHLPPPQTLNPPDARFTLPSQAGPTHPPTGPSGPPTHMSSGPLSSGSSSHGLSGHGSGENAKSTFPSNEERLWAMVRSLEQQMGLMRDTIEALRADVNSLKQAQQG